MRKPVVSVITVCYNAVATIENTILSVLRQTYNEIEYIVVDGGSKDGTVDIINKYKNRISCFISERDRGIYDAMNKGIAAATGDWIIFRNSGDYFADENVIKNVFMDPVPDDVIILHGDCRKFDKYGYIDCQPPIQQKGYSPKCIPVFHPSSFIRSSYHKEHPFDLQYRSSSDFDFFTKCTVQGCRYYYRHILVSVMNIGEGMSVDNLKLVCRENYDILCNNGIVGKSFHSWFNHASIFYEMRFRNWLKKLLPKSYVEAKIISNKKNEGWVLIEKTIPDFVCKKDI